MTNEQYLKNLTAPNKKVDVVLDTDAYNEIDDQFAISYLLASSDKLNTKAIYAAPFHNTRSENAEDGMEKSYDEILRLLEFSGKNVEVFKGSRAFLQDENHFEDSPAARDLVARAENYTAENPLYVVAIGAITNIASALIMKPEIAESIVVVSLLGHARTWGDTKEFNMLQDYAAARVVMASKAPFVQAPCLGVVSEFCISGPEIQEWFCKKGKVADYLARNVFDEVSTYTSLDSDWTRVIWDVVAVAWLLRDDDTFMTTEIVKVELPTYEGVYSDIETDKPMAYISHVNREPLMQDLIAKIKSLG